MTEYRGLNEFKQLTRKGLYGTDQEAIDKMSLGNVDVIEAVRLVEAGGPKLPGVKFKTNQFFVIWTRDGEATTEGKQMLGDSDASHLPSIEEKLKEKDAPFKPVLTEDEAEEILAKIKASEEAAEDFYTAVNCIERELIVHGRDGKQPQLSEGVRRAILQAKREAVALQSRLGTIGGIEF